MLVAADGEEVQAVLTEYWQDRQQLDGTRLQAAHPEARSRDGRRFVVRAIGAFVDAVSGKVYAIK